MCCVLARLWKKYHRICQNYYFWEWDWTGSVLKRESGALRFSFMSTTRLLTIEPSIWFWLISLRRVWCCTEWTSQQKMFLCMCVCLCVWCAMFPRILYSPTYLIPISLLLFPPALFPESECVIYPSERKKRRRKKEKEKRPSPRYSFGRWLYRTKMINDLSRDFFFSDFRPPFSRFFFKWFAPVISAQPRPNCHKRGRHVVLCCRSESIVRLNNKINMWKTKSVSGFWFHFHRFKIWMVAQIIGNVTGLYAT